MPTNFQQPFRVYRDIPADDFDDMVMAVCFSALYPDDIQRRMTAVFAAEKLRADARAKFDPVKDWVDPRPITPIPAQS